MNFDKWKSDIYDLNICIYWQQDEEYFISFERAIYGYVIKSF